MKRVKVNTKIMLIGMLLGLILSTSSYVLADTLINSKNVYYKDNSELMADNVQDAIDGTCERFESKIDNFLNKIYPVGSIYISTTLSTADQVKETLGGEWQAYGNGRTLLSSTGESGKTGGSTTTTLTIDNLPEHTHDISHTHTTEKKDTSTLSLMAEESGEHTHRFTRTAMTWPIGADGTPHDGYSTGGWITNSSQPYNLGVIDTLTSGKHTHKVTGTVTVPSLSTNSISTTSSGPVGKGTAINVQNPYITVYMYKRIN